MHLGHYGNRADALQFPRIADELDRVPEPVNATDQHAPAVEIGAIPDSRRPVPFNLIRCSPCIFEIARQHVAVPEITGGFAELTFLEIMQGLANPSRPQMRPGQFNHSSPLE